MDIVLIISIAVGIGIGWIIRGLVRGGPGHAPTLPGMQPKVWKGPGRIAPDILEHMSEGVVVLEATFRPVFINISARRMLGISSDDLPGQLPSPQVIEAIRRALGRAESAEVVEIAYPQRTLLRVQAKRLQGGDLMAVLKDISEEARTQEMRREFVAHASHELKTPVTSVQTLAEAIMQAIDDDPAAASHFASRLLSEAERLGKLVAGLLDLSRLEEPGTASAEGCDLGEVVRVEVGQLRDLAEERGVAFESSIEGGLELVGDSQQLALLVRNLVENAIQYTPREGNVWVSARRSSSWLLLRVEDSGIGIPREAQARVFERFYRVDKGRSRLHGGTGLGLAIVKHVAELHGASIELQSEIGRGSVFEVWFTPAPARDAASDGRLDSPEKETA
jgi:signal transduction histidine kinase